jgi:hypothetical protein
MPSEWSWYQRVAARWSLGYSNVALPGSQAMPDFARNVSYQLPTAA